MHDLHMRWKTCRPFTSTSNLGGHTRPQANLFRIRIHCLIMNHDPIIEWGKAKHKGFASIQVNFPKNNSRTYIYLANANENNDECMIKGIFEAFASPSLLFSLPARSTRNRGGCR